MLCIFDLDSTLFNVTKRSQEIVRALSDNKDFCKSFPKEAQLLQSITVHHDEWGIKDAVLRLGIRNANAQKAIKKYWSHYFFSNEFLTYDVPYPGAPEFVSDLHQRGAEIVYLTGRDQNHMKEGTIESLTHWKFPIQIENSKLLMKPDKDIKDHEYKKDAIENLLEYRPKLTFDSTWLFENEPANISAIESKFPELKVVFMDSVHSGREDSPTHLPSLKMKFHK